jgi:hypothetical protein
LAIRETGMGNYLNRRWNTNRLNLRMLKCRFTESGNPRAWFKSHFVIVAEIPNNGCLAEIKQKRFGGAEKLIRWINNDAPDARKHE